MLIMRTADTIHDHVTQDSKVANQLHPFAASGAPGEWCPRASDVLVAAVLTSIS